MSLFTPEHVKFLEENTKGVTFKDLTELFNGRFKTGFTKRQIINHCIYRGFKNELNDGGKFFKKAEIGRETVKDKKRNSLLQ